jgi:Tol biopolymer transport system component/tetratricopeptide (TPR) repeat protein
MKHLIKILGLVIAFIIGGTTLSFPQSPEQLFQKGLIEEEGEGDLNEAIDIYNKIVENPKVVKSLQAKALLHVGFCYEKLGKVEAAKIYHRLVNNYSTQKNEVAIAQERLSYLGASTSDLIKKAKTHMRKGNELFRSWDYESAIQEYNDAIKLVPNTVLAQNAEYCIGQSLFKNERYYAALATFERIVENFPKSPIIPVTELMISQVKYVMNNSNNTEMKKNNSDNNTIVDRETGISYTKIKTFVGKNDWITYATGGFNMSPDGRFIVLENKVVPTDGSDPFALVDMKAWRAVYAPDMKKAAFFADSAIWIIPVSTETGHSIGPPQKLIEGKYKFQSPVSWSPDGDKIVFLRKDEKITNEIWTIAVSNGKLTRICKGEGSPVWSPDGKTIVFGKNGDTWVINTKSKEKKMLYKRGSRPQWSSDSKWLYYSKWENSNFYSFENEKNYKFVRPKQVGNFASFTADGKRILFFKPSYNDNWRLKVVSALGGPSFIPASSEPVYGSQWVADSRRILVQGEDSNGDVLFKIIPLSGGNTVEINIDANIKGKPFPFIASPDLTKIAFSVEREDGKGDLYIIPFSMQKAKTTGPARLIFKGWSGGAYNVTFSWSPDGSKIALIHEDDLWIVPLTGGTPVQITNTPESERWIDWSPDGKKISYLTQSKQTRILHIVSGAGGDSRIVYSDCHSAHWSPNSKNLAILSSDEMLILSLDGKKLETIAKLKNLGWDDYSGPRYSTDGMNLAFVGYNDDDKSLIFIYSFESKQITRLAEDNLNDFKYSLRWSPDGKWISYLTEEDVKVRPEGSLWEADFNEVINKVSSGE